MKFSIFASVSAFAISAFAAPAIGSISGLSTAVDVPKRDLLSTLESGLQTAITEVSSIDEEIVGIVNGQIPTLTELTLKLLNLNNTLTTIVQVVEELNLDAGDAVTTVINGLLGIFGLGPATGISFLLTELEQGLDKVLNDIAALGSGTSLYDELLKVAKVIDGSQGVEILSQLGNVIKSVIGLIGRIPIVGPVVSTIITGLLSAL